MIKNLSEITIIDNDATLMLHNKKNGGLYTCNKEQNRITFNDSNGNKIHNHPFTISVNFKLFELTQIGQVINFKDGTMIAYLTSKEVQKLAEKTFYREDQARIYDFIKHEFTIEL